MAKILVLYYSRSGNTEKMAGFVAAGARDAGGEVELKAIGDASIDELTKADAVIVGSPTYYGHSAGPVRTFFDRSVKYHGRLAGKIGGAFSSSHNIGGGNETAILDILHALLIHGMVIQGSADGDHYGPVSIGAPGGRVQTQCRALGERVALLAGKLAGH